MVGTKRFVILARQKGFTSIVSQRGGFCMKRCYRGCPRRQISVPRCAECLKTELYREKKAKRWLDMQELDKQLSRKLAEE